MSMERMIRNSLEDTDCVVAAFSSSLAVKAGRQVSGIRWTIIPRNQFICIETESKCAVVPEHPYRHRRVTGVVSHGFLEAEFVENPLPLKLYVEQRKGGHLT